MGRPSAVIDGHRRFAPGAGRDADRRVVEPQHQHVALDAAGRQPVAGARARRRRRSRSCRRPGATISWLVKPCRCTRVGDQPAVRIVQRQGPEPRLRRDAAQHDVAASVERLAVVVACGRRRRRRRRSRPAARRCARRSRAHRDRCRAVPVFGQAVQAPMVTPPKAVPRVSASQVAPRPIAAATVKANNDPKSRRTVDPIGGTELSDAHGHGEPAADAQSAADSATAGFGRAPPPIGSRRTARHLGVGRLVGRSPRGDRARGWRHPSAARRAPARRCRAWSARSGAAVGWPRPCAAVGHDRRAVVGRSARGRGSACSSMPWWA